MDPNDPAFAHPSKPIGPVYSTDEAARVARDHGWSLVRESSGDRRRVVPSPLPLRIIGLDSIKVLLDARNIVICAGGGGIPVVRNATGEMEGVEAVIEKDRTSALLALGLNSDALLLLTDVAGIFREFGSLKQCIVETISPSEIENLELPPGSMGPKASAAASFIRDGGKFAGIGCQMPAPYLMDMPEHVYRPKGTPKNEPPTVLSSPEKRHFGPFGK